jgi:hypothetical protein
VRIDPDPHHLDQPLQSNDEADPWRTFFSRGDATLPSTHARTSSTATGDISSPGQPDRRPNQRESARSRQGQSTTRANRPTPDQPLTENQKRSTSLDTGEFRPSQPPREPRSGRLLLGDSDSGHDRTGRLQPRQHPSRSRANIRAAANVVAVVVVGEDEVGVRPRWVSALCGALTSARPDEGAFHQWEVRASPW